MSSYSLLSNKIYNKLICNNLEVIKLKIINKNIKKNKKKISLEEAYTSPYYEKYCKPNELLEYIVFSGKNNENYDYFLDPDNIRFKEADKNNITFVISATVPGAQELINYEDAPIFCKLTNDYFKNKVDIYNKNNNTFHSFFAILPFNNPESCLNELKRINTFNPPINRVLFNGPTINDTKYEWLEDKKWNIVWEYANNNKTIFYIHPYIALSYSNKLPDENMNEYNYKYSQLIGSQFGFHISDGLFFLKLYINNIFDNYENIQWISGHMGETLLWYLWRFDHRTKIYKNEVKNYKINFPNDNINFLKFPKKSLTELFKTQNGKLNAQIVCTTSGWFYTPALNFAIDVIGTENILFSIDTPYESLDDGVNWFDNTELSLDDYTKISYENANRILKLF